MDSRTFRDIIGRFATGVTVVTTEVDGLVHGMTANAFASVSLDPLLLLVCVERTARCHRQLTLSERFGINFLAEDQADVSNNFARSLEPSEDFEGFTLMRGATGVPLLSGCLAHFECAKHAVFDGGDHDIFVGRVEDGGLIRADDEPLVFFAGRYRTLGPNQPA